MSNNYDGDSGKNLEDIDFEEFLAENGELSDKVLQQKPVTEKPSRRLISAIGNSQHDGSGSGEKPSKDLLSDDKPSADRQDSDVIGSEQLVNEQLGSDKLGSDKLGSEQPGSDRLGSDRLGSEQPGSDRLGSDRLGSDRLTSDNRGRIVERMAWSTRQKLIVAFQGEAGAYSEQALRNYFGPDATSLPCTDFAGIFEAIHSGKSQRGILPVENSLAGTVSDAYDQLADQDLRIQGEVILRVEHCLMAPAGLKLRDIKRVKSHPQALSQCQQTLRRQRMQAIVHYDTAGAARDLAARPEPGTAAIASALAAKTYGLEILARHFEDEPLNYTRFFILGLNDPPRKDPSKTSVIFTTRHQPGALHRVLSELAERNINLTKIESRPRRNRPWHYLFYVDFEGHEDERETQEALLGILKQASFLKVLGSYPTALMPTTE